MTNLILGKYLFIGSIFLFFLCLLFPGFYTGIERIPNFSANLLATGWLGPLNGHFSWFATPIYFIALFLHASKPKIARVFSFIAILIALSFLGYDEIIKDANGGTAPIMGVGWGYFLWVTSFILLLIACLLKSNENKKIYNKIILSIPFISLMVFIHHFYIKDESQFRIESGREIKFSELCQISKEKIHIDINHPINGIYFNTSGGRSFGKISNGTYKNWGSAVFSSRGVKNLSFIEKDSYHHKYKGFKYIRDIYQPHREEIPTNDLISEIIVLTTSLVENIPKSYGIISERIEIRYRESGELIAETTYVATKINRAFCGKEHLGYYDTNIFVLRALKLIG